MTERQRDAVAVATLVALKAAAMLYALHCGFQQISDDDYARTVIAQMFVHQPKLDPSGTSWLPLPFWFSGSLMMIVGRSLAAARTTAFLLGVVSPWIVFASLRAMELGRGQAWLGTVVGALTPWSAWLGLATVPEGWAACITAAALFFLAAGHTTRAGLLSLVGTLARYESWPAAVVVVVVGLARARLEPRTLVGVVAAALGPALWLAHNAHAHQDMFHFITRVTAYHATHAAPAPLTQRLTAYPVALVCDAPDVLAAAVLGGVAIVCSRTAPRAWLIPLVGAALIMAFLVAGNLRGGAPTHHGIRALMPVVVILGAFGGAAIGGIPVPGLAVLGAAWFVFLGLRIRAVPGAGTSEQRVAQIERGRTLSASSARFEVTPCAYEHFAFIAALGAPERVRINDATHEAVTSACPHVRPIP